MCSEKLTAYGRKVAAGVSAAECNALAVERTELAAERGAMAVKRDELNAERDALQEERERLESLAKPTTRPSSK